MLAEAGLIILRYTDGAVHLTGWGGFVLGVLAVWIGIFSKETK